jgi:hypothetical protein
MSVPERREREGIHPNWLRQIYPSRNRLGNLGREARSGKKTLDEQIMRTDRLHASLSVQGAGLEGASEVIEFLLQPDIREVIFHEKISDLLHERQGLAGLRVLVVNLGNKFHDFAVPVEIAEHAIDTTDAEKLRDNPLKIDFLGPLYNGDLRGDCTELFRDLCIFSEVTEEEITHKNTDDEEYDLMIVYGDDNEKNEGGVPRRSRTRSMLIAQRLTKALKRGGSIVVSGNESLDMLGNDLLDAAASRDDFSSESFSDHTFVDMHSQRVYALSPLHGDHTVKVINRNGEIVQPIVEVGADYRTRQSDQVIVQALDSDVAIADSTRRRLPLPHTPKGWAYTSGGVLVLSAATTVALLASSSPEPACPDGSTTLTPVGGSTNSPEFQIPNGGPVLTVTVMEGTEIMSAQGYSPREFPYRKNTVTIQPGNTIFTTVPDSGSVLGCAVEAIQTPTSPSESVSPNSAAIPAIVPAN